MRIESSVRGMGLVALVGIALVSSGCSRSPEAKSAKFMAEGKKLLEKKDPARAILQFQNAAQATPRDAEVYYQLAQAYIAANDATTGVAFLRKALVLDPKHAAARLRLAELQSMVDDPDTLRKAQKSLQELVAEGPNNADALHALAFTELKLGETQDALDLLGRALAAAPQEVVIAVTLAEAKLQQRDPKGAEAILKQASEHSPNSADAAVVLGRFYASQNRTAEAEAQFQRAVTIDRDSETALLNLAMLQYETGKKADAEQYFKRLSALPGKNYRSTYAVFLFEEGRHDEAIHEFEKLVKADPEDRTVRTRLITAYRATNRTPDAEKILNDALKKNPRDLEALLQRGEISLAAGKDGPAEKDFNQVVSLKPDSSEVHYALGKLYLAQGATARYRDELSNALRIDPNAVQVRLELAQALLADGAKSGATAALYLLNSTPPFQKELTPVIVKRNWALWILKNFAEMRKEIDHGLLRERSPDLLLQDAMWKLQAGNLSGGRAALEEALKIDATDLNALSLLSQTFVAQKQSGAALKIVQEYVARQPKSAPMQEFLGTVMLTNGDRAGARAAFVAAKAADPHYAKADLSLVQLDALERKWDDAESKLKTMVASDAPNSPARLWLADVEAVKGDLPAALDHYRKVVERDPQNARALNNLAFVLLVYSKRPDEALNYAQKAVELAPGNADYADTLGWVFYNKGLYGPAITYLERAASKTGNAAWKYHLAMAYAKAGEPKKAQTTLQLALKVNPRAPEAEAALNLVGPAK